MGRAAVKGCALSALLGSARSPLGCYVVLENSGPDVFLNFGNPTVEKNHLGGYFPIKELAWSVLMGFSHAIS